MGKCFSSFLCIEDKHVLTILYVAWWHQTLLERQLCAERVTLPGKVIIPNDVTCQKYPIILFYEGCNYKPVQRKFQNSLNFGSLTPVNIKVCQVSAVIQVLYIWFAPLSNFLLVWLHDWSRNDAFLRISQFNNYKKKICCRSSHTHDNQNEFLTFTIDRGVSPQWCHKQAKQFWE